MGSGDRGHWGHRWRRRSAASRARRAGPGGWAPGPLSDLVARAVEAETGVAPTLSTSGGTSDARFVKDHCPVVEFGLVGRTMHQVDECVETAQIRQLKTIYERVLRDYFAG
ncbi:MAG: M20/M25/M40 family metallo-hydrolase [Halochromatium sp.]